MHGFCYQMWEQLSPKVDVPLVEIKSHWPWRITSAWCYALSLLIRNKTSALSEFAPVNSWLHWQVKIRRKAEGQVIVDRFLEVVKFSSVVLDYVHRNLPPVSLVLRNSLQRVFDSTIGSSIKVICVTWVLCSLVYLSLPYHTTSD